MRVLLEREDFCLSVYVDDVCVLCVPCGTSQCLILDPLQFREVCVTDDR